MPTTIAISNVSHNYGERRALTDVSFAVSAGEIFGLLGPNGGGKSTLFRLISTLLPLQMGAMRVCDLDVTFAADQVRERIGVTFQAPSLDKKLTVTENLRFQGYLYGLSGAVLQQRIDDLLLRLGLTDRSRDLAGTLSGGLQRRVEIAKGLLHKPQVLLLDEPSTGLDAGARIDLWRYLNDLRLQQQVTVLVTTHLMDEAERCDRLGILHLGALVASGSPDELRRQVGGDCLTIDTPEPSQLREQIETRFHCVVQVVGHALRIEHAQGHELLRDLVAAFPEQIRSINLGRPTLEDVFIQKTGHRFWESDEHP